MPRHTSSGTIPSGTQRMPRLCTGSWITVIGRRGCCPRSRSHRTLVLAVVVVARPAAVAAAVMAATAPIGAVRRRAGRTPSLAPMQPMLLPPSGLLHPRRRSQPPVRPARRPARGRTRDAPIARHCADACLCCQFTDRLVRSSPIRSPFGGLPRCDPSAQCRKCQPQLHSIRR